jgi:uncharacterized membrane protein YraQ (UPF0718 family)
LFTAVIAENEIYPRSLLNMRQIADIFFENSAMTRYSLEITNYRGLMRKQLLDPSTIAVLILTLLGAGKVYMSGGFPAISHIFMEDLTLFGAVVLKVLAGCLIAAFLFLLLPREVITRWIGAESGLKGLIIALFVGILFPSGPFNIYPLAVALRLAGAGTGPVITFITAWALIGMNRAIVWEMPFLTTSFVFERILWSLPMPIIAGLLAQMLEKRVFAK